MFTYIHAHIPKLCYKEGLGTATPNSHNTLCVQTLASKYHPQPKGTRAPWGNGCLYSWAGAGVGGAHRMSLEHLVPSARKCLKSKADTSKHLVFLL